ncbi:histidine kinase-, DNA gyrase B-, and HSP90-like ATPase family protein, partial [Vibrio parahaemolyticus AQ3810]
HARNVY